MGNIIQMAVHVIPIIKIICHCMKKRYKFQERVFFSYLPFFNDRGFCAERQTRSRAKPISGQNF